MKKILALLLAFTLTFSLSVTLCACDSANGNSNGGSGSGSQGGSEGSGEVGDGSESGESNEAEKEPFSVDLAGYVANISCAVALGISRGYDTGNSTVSSYGNSGYEIMLLSNSTLESQNGGKNKSYIVMSTTDYGANTPEADENGLTKVTFTKITTENATTEITGDKYITAKNGSVTVNAANSFEYSLYLGNKLIATKIADNQDPEHPNKKIFITFDGLTDGTTYKLTYRGVGTETTITQDEINGEIDKLCVLGNFTFISFVPEGTSERPLDSSLTYGEDGVATYDKCGYFSSDTRQSFVLDNTTGYVYQIKDTAIDKIENNLIIINEKIYDMRIGADDELEFYTVVQNETLEIQHYFKDKYGNKYIQNAYLDCVDESNNTVYYTKKLQYFFSKDQTVIHRTGDEYGWNTESIKKIYYNLEERDIESQDYFYFDRYTLIEDGWLYITHDYGNYRRINVATLENEYGQQDEPIGDYAALIDHKTILIFWDGNLYYGDVWGNKAAYPNGITNGWCTDNLKLLLEGVVRTSIGNYTDWVFRKTTLTETLFYKVIIDENGCPKIVSESYIAPEETVISLQPINK